MNSDANAQYHLLKFLVNLGIIDNFVLSQGRFLPLKESIWRSR